MYEGLEKVRENLKNGKYENKEKYPKEGNKPEKFIFDENLSVKKNREMVEEFNQKINEQRKAYNKGNAEASNLFHTDVVKAIESDASMSRKAAELIFERAYENGHSSGYNGVLQEADDFIGFYEELKEAEKT